jgi:hypothetical protein
VNGIAPADEFLTSDVVADIGKRLGYDTSKVNGGGSNALPFDLTDGAWGESGLTYMAGLDDWRWLVLGDAGHGSILDFGPWDRTWHVFTSQDAAPDLQNLPRYNRVVVQYTSVNGTPQEVEVLSDEGPFTNGVYRTWYEQLSDPQPDAVLATSVANILLARLSSARVTGSIDIVDAREDSGVGSPYAVLPGSFVDLADWMPAQSLVQRIMEVAYTSTSIRLGVETPVSIDGVVSQYNLAKLRKGRTIKKKGK